MSTQEEFGGLLKQVSTGADISSEQAELAFGAIMTGQVSDIQIAAFLTALAVRKPTVAEITGAVRAMRGQMRRLSARAGAIDLCGTGGDGHGTLNVSTAVSFVVAGCGVTVAKHGNRNMSSRTGAADALEALGVKIDVTPDVAERCLSEAGLCFLFAQTYHPAMKYVGPVRKALGFRTIFNLLGPLSNPAGVKRQLIGVYSEDWIEPVAQALLELGTEKAWIVHGGDGLDEMTTTTTTHVAVLEKGEIRRTQVSPADIDIPMAELAQLKGGDAAENAASILRLLDGEKSAYRDIVILNAAAALVVADKVPDITVGARLAAESLDYGKARSVLNRLIASSHVNP